MFDFPKQAELNRPVPKSKIYEFAKPSRAIRERFARQIAEIVWAYKLSPETINLPARDSIHEIQIFSIALKGRHVRHNASRELTATALRPILLSIDKAIPSPVFYQLTLGDRAKFTAAYKRPSDADPAKSVVESAYFETPWQPHIANNPANNTADNAPELSPLPLALDLASLYEQMLRRLIPIPPRPGESLRNHVERVNQVRAKETECRRLDARLRRELQFNRKVEINAALRTRQTELAQLQQV
jgi:hypothetical protein